eukprot:3892144-Rhodomonas_salina.2
MRPFRCGAGRARRYPRPLPGTARPISVLRVALSVQNVRRRQTTYRFQNKTQHRKLRIAVQHAASQYKNASTN